MTQVNHYSLYRSDLDQYSSSHDLCTDCSVGFVASEFESLHYDGPTNQPCEVCKEMNDKERDYE